MVETREGWAEGEGWARWRGGAEMVREQLFEVTFPRWFAHGHPTIDSVGSLAGGD